MYIDIPFTYVILEIAPAFVCEPINVFDIDYATEPDWIARINARLWIFDRELGFVKTMNVN